MSRDKMLSKEELLKWLENIVNHSCVLGITHPHLATHPTNNDDQAYVQLKQMIENQPEVGETILDDWAREIADILWDKTKYSDRINFLRKKGKKLLAEAGVKIMGEME